MKRLLLVVLVLAICSVLLIGCGTTTTTTPSGPTTSITPAGETSTKGVVTSPAAPIPAAPTKPTTTAPTSPTTPTKPKETTGPVYGGILRIVEAGAPGGAIGYPPEIAGGAGVTAQFSLQQLIEQSSTGEFLPNLAESFDVDSDPEHPSVTYHIRKGVKFHDGTSFNAHDVKWNFDLIKDGVNPSTTAQWKSWEVLDDYTIRVDLKSWRNINVRGFTGIGALMASPTAYNLKGEEWVRWNMVGTGAFKQAEFSQDVRYRGVRNDDYWEEGKPYLEGIDVEYVADELTRIALFKNGDVDVMAVSPKDAYEFQKEGYTIIRRLGGANALYPDSMNEDSIFANQKVRMAIEYAIDKEAMAKAFGYGFEPAAYQVPNPDMRAFIPTIEGRKYDPEKAKALLAEAGYPSGFKSVIITSNTMNRDACVAVQAYLAAVGIDMELDFYEPAKLFGVLLGTWNDALVYHQTRNFPDFNASLNLEFGVPYTTFFKSTAKPEGFKEALDATLATTFEEVPLMQKCAQMLYDDCTVIPTTYYSSLWVTPTNIHDTGHGAYGSTTQSGVQNAWISKD